MSEGMASANGDPSRCNPAAVPGRLQATTTDNVEEVSSRGSVSTFPFTLTRSWNRRRGRPACMGPDPVQTGVRCLCMPPGRDLLPRGRGILQQRPGADRGEPSLRGGRRSRDPAVGVFARSRRRRAAAGHGLAGSITADFSAVGLATRWSAAIFWHEGRATGPGSRDHPGVMRVCARAEGADAGSLPGPRRSSCDILPHRAGLHEVDQRRKDARGRFARG